MGEPKAFDLDAQQLIEDYGGAHQITAALDLAYQNAGDTITAQNIREAIAQLAAERPFA